MIRKYAFTMVLVWSLASHVSAYSAQFSLAEIDRPLAAIAVHAQNYPPRFESAQQRQAQTAELQGLLGLLGRAAEQYPDDVQILSRLAKANALGHNLDLPQCAEVAIKSYKHLLEIEPDNAEEQFQYGAFLSGTTFFKAGIEPLHRAIALGKPDAHYTLAFVYLKLNDNGQAIRELKEYQKSRPGNASVDKLIQEIESGHIHVKTLPLQ